VAERIDAPDDAGALRRAQARLDEAMAAYRAARDPGSSAHRASVAAALFERGNALHAAGRLEDAAVSYGDAVQLWPGHAAAHNNLGSVLDALGHPELALASYRRALGLADDATVGMNFARCVRKAAVARDDAELRTLVARALIVPWARPGELASIAGDLLCRLSEADRTREPLFAALLTSAPLAHDALERHVSALRRALLEGTLDDLPLACVIAQQGFINEYVWDEDEAETATVDRLAREAAQALERGVDVSATRIAVLAAYRPLHELNADDRLLEGAWPEALRAVIALQVDEPRRVDALRATVPALTPIRDAVSRRVQAQYEDNPYPRWIDLPRATPVPFAGWLAHQVAGAHVDLPDARPLEMLIAGCGTGQEAIELAERHPDARVTAIDLSRASLAYAAFKSRERGVTNVEHAQADLMELPALGRRYDVVSAGGVLHHLADPLAGWRALVECLRPGGVMHLGLYSAFARRDVDAARAFVATRADPPTHAGIRAARAALRADPRFTVVTSLRDFFATSECRDLLFHVQEQAFTLPRIARALDDLGLAFMGFVLEPAVLRRYREANAEDPAAADLARWDAFERADPATFLGMYQFWVRKPG
jgi:2-polyprenyl-3-methyl-5-hydroxy-6-metoxy-1,4-benzoquinol methylase